MLEIFLRTILGEEINVRELADDYGVSTKSITRDISEIRNFLHDKRELSNFTDLKYSGSSKTYSIEFDNILLSKELIAIIKAMIGCRAFSKEELQTIINKLKTFTSRHDATMLDQIIGKEMLHYSPVGSDCESVIDQLWKLTRCIHERKEISVSYYKVNRKLVTRRIMPVAITFSDYYFYLIAYRCDKDDWKPLYYRIGRIENIVEHRKHFTLAPEHDFDVGELRKKIQFMFPGEFRKIKFSYTGPSVQAILDRLPTAKVVEEKDGTYIIEAEIYGTGINMFLLSQGRSVKVLGPDDFVEEMKQEIAEMKTMYEV
ncbi:MAG TPA: WYL domain-containing protein [Veillonellaceae bacterium]|nr:WYL domain-containing protein [Veillonellaceae bacterium]